MNLAKEQLKILTMNKEFLYSPWRLNYIESEKTDECILCRYQETDKDEENIIVYRGKYCYVMLNRYPYNNGHLMIIPYQHSASITDLDDKIWLEMCSLLKDTEQILTRVYNCDGINIGINLGCAAGAGIAEHIHIHIVPRWNGDSNFMSVIGGERVIPESFENAYNKLAPAFANLINNEEININDGCNLNLKYNDVIRLAGRTNPNSEVAVFFADQEYTAKSDNNGNWVILISVPYIKNGEYKLLNKADNVLICRIQLNIKSDVSSQNNNDSQDTKNNTLIYTITSIIVFSVVIYLYSKNIKRKKSSESS